MSFADPLWEYVLDDYEDENASLFSKFSMKKKKKKKANYDDKSSVGSRSFLSSKRGSRAEYRDDDEVKDSVWDVISGKPPKAAELRRSRSFSGRTKSSASRSKQRSSSLTRSQSSVSEYDAYSNDSKKKSKFKKRFSWKDNHKASEGSSLKQYAAPNARSVKHTSLADDRDDNTKASERDFDADPFDPMYLLFKIADTLDPWGLDSEASFSDSDTDDDGDRYSNASRSHAGSASDSRSSRKSRTKKIDSLLGQQMPNSRFNSNRFPYQPKEPKKEENNMTEIRLKVNPVGNTLSEEVFEKNTTTFGEELEDEIYKVPSIEDVSYDMFATSFDSDTFQSSLKIAGEADPPAFDVREQIETKEKRDSLMNERAKPATEEKRVPTSPRRTQRAQSNNRDDMSKDSGNAKTSTGLKKAMCGLKKLEKNDTLVIQSTESEVAEAFPSSRMIIDGESHLVTESDPARGKMGPMVSSKGPQPVFAYDYESNMNMDVIYVKPNHKPRTSLSVRKLGTPPPISSVLGADNIVIQVEASTVSETDCIIRQGLWWGNSKPSYPSTPGIDVVGKVYCTKQTTERVYGLKPMQTVMSLVKWGGNTRFMTIHPKQLVPVPEGLDPADVACLPECYLSAFQVLHMGQTGSNRYRENSLKGKSILILGCMTNNMGKAMIELALHAGAKQIFATAKKKHWKTLLSYGVHPLSTDPMKYIQRIAGTIDLVLAPNGNLREDVSPVHFRALVPRYGQLIISGHRIVGNDIPLDEWKKSRQTPSLSCGKNKALQKILRNSVSYDVYDEWEKNLELCKKDLTYLLTLLESKAIKPEVLDRIPLNKVAKAHELLESKRLPGFLVCEPWIKSKKRALYL